eukprot:ANDGO_08102.mRNA.1 hypothetical protein
MATQNPAQLSSSLTGGTTAVGSVGVVSDVVLCSAELQNRVRVHRKPVKPSRSDEVPRDYGNVKVKRRKVAAIGPSANAPLLLTPISTTALYENLATELVVRPFMDVVLSFADIDNEPAMVYDQRFVADRSRADLAGWTAYRFIHEVLYILVKPRNPTAESLLAASWESLKRSLLLSSSSASASASASSIPVAAATSNAGKGNGNRKRRGSVGGALQVADDASNSNSNSSLTSTNNSNNGSSSNSSSSSGGGGGGGGGAGVSNEALVARSENCAWLELRAIAGSAGDRSFKYRLARVMDPASMIRSVVARRPSEAVSVVEGLVWADIVWDSAGIAVRDAQFAISRMKWATIR